MSGSKLGEIVLDVGEVGHGGVCVGRDQDRVVFVRHALPGERVRAVVTEDSARFLRADAVEVLAASADRVPPPCPYAGPGRCGGCDWQHVAPPAQRELKARVVAEQLQRLAGLAMDVEVEPVPGDDGGLGWRTRVQFAVTDSGALGFRRHRSHDIEPVARCLIAHPGVEAVGAARLSWHGADTVEVIAGSSGDRAVVVTPRSKRRRPQWPELADGVSRLAGDEALSGRPGVREVALGRSWWVGGSGFWQVHPGAAETLAAAVIDTLAPRPGDLALDLYGGVGLFAAALAPHVREVVLVESDPRACADAQQNLADVQRLRIETGRVDHALERLGLGRADIVVLDPPRTGAGKVVVEAVAALQPRTVAYVACDPAALARDVATFASAGYACLGVRAFDLFPMTHHVECVARIERAEP